jgi:hypothetical protein
MKPIEEEVRGASSDISPRNLSGGLKAGYDFLGPIRTSGPSPKFDFQSTLRKTGHVSF